MGALRGTLTPNDHNNSVWRSFAANYATNNLWKDPHYNNHGHVGFAWGARRDVLSAIPLYDKALIGGADHIMAHAAVGQINHPCITKSFTDDIDAINEWSTDFYHATQGKLGYTKGDLYHIWHGELDKRNYYNRIKDFTKQSKSITQRDQNGLFIAHDSAQNYMLSYFLMRETLDDNSPLHDKVEEFQGNGGEFGGAGASGGWDNPQNARQDEAPNAPSPAPFS
jgi:hypothetical protein